MWWQAQVGQVQRQFKCVIAFAAPIVHGHSLDQGRSPGASACEVCASCPAQVRGARHIRQGICAADGGARVAASVLQLPDAGPHIPLRRHLRPAVGAVWDRVAEGMGSGSRAVVR